MKLKKQAQFPSLLTTAAEILNEKRLSLDFKHLQVVVLHSSVLRICEALPLAMFAQEASYIPQWMFQADSSSFGTND